MATPSEPASYDLQRFVEAQGGSYETALEELRRGRKQSHWMWFIFPQIRGLGASPTAHHYGIASLDEARAYLAHPVLGPRLVACTEAVLSHGTPSLRAVFGSPDDMKFRSCMTLFARAASHGEPVFRTALDRLCGGDEDGQTLRLVGLG